jgi:hypothetical protein
VVTRRPAFLLATDYWLLATSFSRIFLLATGYWLLATLPAPAGDLKLFPPAIELHGSSNHRLLLLEMTGTSALADRTGEAEFDSSNPKVATVDASGIVHGVGDGEAIVTASVGKELSTAKVRVIGSKEPVAWSFKNQVIPMMTKVGCNSGACHGALAGKRGFKLSLRGYAPDIDHFVMTRQALGRRVDTTEPDRSLLLKKPTLVIPHGGGQKLEVGSADFNVLAGWIASGAPGPKPGDSQIQRLEVFPCSATLKPGAKLQVLVRAGYSDGRTEDVTHWAKFNSTEDLVAAVDSEGRVKVAGHGETAITVWYSNLVAICRVASPLPNQVDGKVFAAAPVHNFVDKLVLNKLQALHIPPSPECTDAEFIRRVFLDAAGILPTPEEVDRFLKDTKPDKRARLIESLLDRPEFIDYWTYKWGDLFLLSTGRMAQPALWSFYQYLRSSVADNKPWDRLARELLTAQGSTLRNGAANYFKLHVDVTDLTETTAVTFLGMSITCARCHNHPMEKWTQDQYWSMANLFSRVALKNGDLGGDVSVEELPTGDVAHPRLGVPLAPAPLDAKPMSSDSSASRRQYFADWLTDPRNPYFAKAFVNRVWRNFMGRGLVEAEDDLRQTNPPTNPELFDALAADFIEHHFDVKHLMRTIMNSATYQRSATSLPGNREDDRFYSHYLIRRLPAEVILDAYTKVTSAGDSFAIYADEKVVYRFPAGTRAQQLPDVRVASVFLDSFGRPERSQTCSCERQQDSSVSQALHLNNGQTLNDKLRAKDSRVQQWVDVKLTDQESVERLFKLALCREPTPQEMHNFLALMAEAKEDKTLNPHQRLEDLFWAVLTGKEFLFNH